MDSGNKTEVIEPGKITPPNGSFFIHGIRGFGAGSGFMVGQFGRGCEEVSISLQADGLTLPLRPYGYIIEVDNGAIVKASARDMSTMLLGGVKHATVERGDSYDETQLTDLLAMTKRGGHNEITVLRNGVEVAGAYVVEGSETGIPGIRKFLQACREKKMPVHIIPKEILEIEKTTESE